MDTRSSMRRALIGALAAAALSLAPGCGDEPGARPEAEAHAWRLSDPFVQAVNRGVALMGRYQYGSAAEASPDAQLFSTARTLKGPAEVLSTGPLASVKRS